MKTPLQLCILLAIAGLAALFAQGPLTPPPGAPGPTMKTLQQIEPRTDLATVAGDADYHHVITTAGSYYLTGNLVVTKANGIDVRAEGVTLDLNGFEIRGAVGARGHGIEVDAAAHRCTIKNGSLKSFGYGLWCELTGNFARGGRCLYLSVSGCSEGGLAAGEGWQLEGCTAQDNAGTAIAARIGSSLSNCTASANNGFAGISAGDGSTLTNCTAVNNTTKRGIFVGDGCTLTNCSVTMNTSAAADTDTGGIYAGSGCTLTNCSAYENTTQYGIYAGNGCTLKNCTARKNTASATLSGGILSGTESTLIGCTAGSNTNTNAANSSSTGFGLRIFSSSTVQECSISGNDGDGLQVDGDRCQIADNNCSDNTQRGGGANIHLTSTTNACRIDGNHCAGGTRGFLIEGADNLIVRNSAQGASVLAYGIVAGNHTAEIFNNPGLSFTSTSPWANFKF